MTNSDQSLRQRAYTAANSKLRERHQREFQELYRKACEDYGVEYTGRLTGEAKAKRDLAKIKSKYPHLVEGS